MIVLGKVYVYLGGEELINEISAKLLTNFVYSFETLGVDESRTIKERLSLKQEGRNAWTLIFAKNITKEAQNALLKCVEDLSVNLGLVFILPFSSQLLETFLSRVILLETDRDSSLKHPLHEEADRFISLTVKERINYMRKHNNIELLDALEEWCHNNDILDAKNIFLTKELFSQGAVSVKMALEHLVYLLPRL
ncbi:MAG TPA: hypothetical protein VJI73_00695 [Candidatus Paceibacterota bacterium]